jgi:hypothetical protein
MFKQTFIGVILAAGSLIALAPTAAQAQYNAIISVAPPPPLYEVPPPPRRGHVWAPGHQEWRGNRYEWVPGHWLRDRAGYEYREPRWIQRGNGEWSMIGGNWEHRYLAPQERQFQRDQRRYLRGEGPDPSVPASGLNGS